MSGKDMWLFCCEMENFDMAKKKRHMTKKEYEITSHRIKRRRSGSRMLSDVEPQEDRHIKSEYVKYRKRSDAEMKKHLRNIREYSDDILDLDEEYNTVA
jgi:hypothetical protein